VGPESWDTFAAWMRVVGASEASWSPDGRLLTLKLGPAPVTAADENETQSSLSPVEQERRAREQRREMSLRASGGPVMRLDAHG
jgi:hypothetical protein